MAARGDRVGSRFLDVFSLWLFQTLDAEMVDAEAGVRTKTSQDYEYTNWDDVAAMADRFWELGAFAHRRLV